MFVYHLVADFMDIGLSRKDAVDVAAGLLAANYEAFNRRFTRPLVGTTLAPRTLAWKPSQEQLEVDVEGRPISLPIGAMVWMAWERASQRRADYGVPDKGIRLGSHRVGRIYDDLAAEHSVAGFVVCPDCGHRNQHNPARDQVFWFGDSCRKCGAGTGDVDSDPDPVHHR